MSHCIPLSRIARLVGCPRGRLQQMVKNGELATQDGQVELAELLRVFPDVRWEDDGEYRRVEEIKAKAFGKRILERVLPDKEVLAERLYELGREFASAKSLLIHYDQLLRWIDERLAELAEEGGSTARLMELRRQLRRQIEDAPKEAERCRALLAEESVMRVMAAHVRVEPSGHEFFVEGNDTLLEAALRAGVPLNYGCSNGNCGECRARLRSGQIKKVHPHDFALSEAEKASGVFLMCSCTAVSDLVIEAAVMGAEDIPEQTIPSRVRSIERIGERMRILHLTTPRSQRLRFLAGQSVTLEAGGHTGEYPIANCPCEDRQLSFHIRRDNRPFVRYVFEDLRKEDVVRVIGPHGRNVFALDSRRPALFVAWEDGFAPIQSLIQHAMSLETAEAMHLYWAAAELGHYRDNLCRSWADALDNFHYHPVFARSGMAAAAAEILADFSDLAPYDLYAAGPAEFLDALRAAAFARGLPPQAWHGEVLL